MKVLVTICFLIIINQLFSQCNEPLYNRDHFVSYLGGTGEDEVMDIVSDPISENIFILGKTTSNSFLPGITVLGLGSSHEQGFVACLNKNSDLLWSTLISAWDDPQAIHLNNDGSLTLVGTTALTTLPASPSTPSHDNSHNGGRDILILKLNNNGNSIIYQSYYGGNGDENKVIVGQISGSASGFIDRLKVDFKPSNGNIFITGVTTSTNLPITSNAVESVPASNFLVELTTDINQSQIIYSSYYKSEDLNKSSCFIHLPNGESAFIATSGGVRYQNRISVNAINSNYLGYFPNPTLFVFNTDYTIKYCTNIGPWRMNDNDQFGVESGTPDTYNYWNFTLKSNSCGDLYFYSNGHGFKSSRFKSSYLLNSRFYYPPVSDMTDGGNKLSMYNPIIKINFSSEPNPFVERVINYGFNGIGTFRSNSEFELDQSGFLHIVSKGELNSFPNYFGNFDQNNLVKIYYHVFNEDVSNITNKILGYETDLDTRSKIGVTTSSLKSYFFGKINSPTLNTTNIWTDQSGVIQNTLQSVYGGGISNGFLGKVENNCLSFDWDCCNNRHPSYDVFQQFYIATNGNLWTNNTGWTTSCNPCTWYGVSCDAQQNVIGLNLQSNNLSGFLPQSICQLNHLLDLLLAENKISGEIPECLGGMQSLKRLTLNSNKFTGEIPEFFNTPNLTVLTLAANLFIGNIPSSIGDLPLLTFTVNNNELSGCFDLNLMNLCQPWIFQIGINPGNNFDAQWSEFCQNGTGSCCDHPDLIALRDLYTSTSGPQWTNTVAGDLPWMVDCDPCGLLNGTPWKGIQCTNMGRVDVINLSNNNLVGSLPASIGQLAELEWFNVNRNNLSDSLPLEICNLNGMLHFVISNNQFSGNLPACLAGLPALARIVANNNNFTGPLPILGGSNQPGLINLHFDNNMFGSGIPSQYADLPNLNYLAVANNNLSGCYPQVFSAFCSDPDFTSNSNALISDGNSFNATWSQFCATGAGSCTVSTSDQNIADILVYPNPVTSKLFINLNDNKTLIDIKVYDNTGRTHYFKSTELQNEIYTVDVSSLPSGIYFLRIGNNDNQKYTKIIKID